MGSPLSGNPGPVGIEAVILNMMGLKSKRKLANLYRSWYSLPGFVAGPRSKHYLAPPHTIESEASLTEDQEERRRVPKGANRMPSDSVFFDRLVPIILITLGVITVILILVAAGILLGIV